MAEYTQDGFVYVHNCRCPNLFSTFMYLGKKLQITNDWSKRHGLSCFQVTVFCQKIIRSVSFIIKGQLLRERVTWMYPVEWKNRGLPHAHLVVWLTDKLHPKQIDNVIKAEISDENDLELRCILIKNSLMSCSLVKGIKYICKYMNKGSDQSILCLLYTSCKRKVKICHTTSLLLTYLPD